jgi:hypothetical protein
VRDEHRTQRQVLGRMELVGAAMQPLAVRDVQLVGDDMGR